ncbi:CYTH domain-containing protein [Salipiger thiooxidans]|uniref:CYTH domain-containing protein n=1 Tax=Salipiger thiooxidans TaxID=282683 RepID=UPI001A902669|nr:CYTH domain-containing protein [Salipiger thiooxidans]MBN8185642.1 CYTH domain-containing protein [Salipiger thiooxidans]
MAQEIERKFLVASLPDLGEAEARKIRQGYVTVPSDSVQVRLRQKGETFFLTVKGQGGLVRSEHEAEISAEAFDALWPSTGDRRIEKVRWTGRLENGHVYELDLFEDRDLRLVEVEFASEAEAEAFEPPAWFGEDVTGNHAYSNNVLASGGAA